MKFRNILLVIMLLFSLGPLYLLGMIMLYENERIAEDIVAESLETISKTQIMDIENFCMERKSYMSLIRQYNVVKDEIMISLGEKEADGTDDMTYLESILNEHVRSDSSIASISIIDAEFGVVASTEAYAQGELCDLAGADEACRSGQFVMSDVYRRKIDDRMPGLVAAHYGIYTDGKLIGYIVEEIYTSHFNRYRNSIDQLLGGKMYIVDGKGEYITVGIAKNEQGKPEYDMTEEEEAEYDKKWNEIDWEKNHSGFFYYTAGGKKHIVYYSDMKYSDWKICVNEDLSSYKDRTEQFRRLLMVALCVLSGTMVIVIIGLSTKLTKPLRRIMETLANVRKEHDYSMRVEFHGKDEFGRLSEEIDALLVFAEEAERKEQKKQESLVKEVEKDPLTGIYNKKAIKNRVEELLSEKGDSGIVIGFVDIDDFRDYNTLYGHQAGDEVICFVAHTLEEQMGEYVGRYGGDEFLFCLSDMDDRQKVSEYLDAYMALLQEGFYNEKLEKKMGVPCSIGVAMGRTGEVTFRSLVETADAAMYQTKNNGRMVTLFCNHFFHIGVCSKNVKGIPAWTPE